MQLPSPFLPVLKVEKTYFMVGDFIVLTFTKEENYAVQGNIELKKYCAPEVTLETIRVIPSSTSPTSSVLHEVTTSTPPPHPTHLTHTHNHHYHLPKGAFI